MIIRLAASHRGVFLHQLPRNSGRQRQLSLKRADMAINKAKVAIGFMVAGVLAVILGTVLTFVGPIIIDDQVVKVSRPFSICTIFLMLSLRGEFVDVLSQTLST